MSFASDAKKELTQVDFDQQTAKAELEALVRMNGTIGFGPQGLLLNVQTENAAIARRIYTLFKACYDLNGEIIVRRKMKLKKNNVYIVRAAHHVDWLLDDLEILSQGLIRPQVQDAILANSNLRRAYLRGAFLAGGSVNNPETSSYHLEIYSSNEIHANNLAFMLQTFELYARIIPRRGGYVAYLKEAEKISDFLALIGAMKAVMHFEDIRVMRDMRNDINRLVNCENANLNKTIDAASRQIAMIEAIDRVIGLEELPESLREVARARLENPEVSLKELGAYLKSGPISKSAINHRFRKLKQIAEEIN